MKKRKAKSRVIPSPAADDAPLDQPELTRSLALLDLSMEEVKAGRGQPLKQAVLEIADELGLKLD